MKFPEIKARSKELLVTIDDFSGGTNTLVDQSRLKTKFAVQSNNLIQVSDGLWKTRWGTKNYGLAHAAEIDGAQEYVKSDGTTELITIANGKAWQSTDGGTLTEITGATFTAGVQCSFLQIAGWDTSSGTYKSYLYISNGTDNLVRYNGTTLETYTERSAPTSLTASITGSGLTSGSYAYYAQVTALNAVGETTGSTEASMTVNKLRDNWTTATNDQVTWSWGTVTGATRYQLYLSDQSGYEALLGSSNTTSFVDNGSNEINPYVTVPTANTTGAPKFKSMAVSNNRFFATNDPNNIYYVYFSGTGKNIGNFSDFYGGGWIALERGGRELPIAVKHYQTGAGAGIATILAKTPDGKGAVWQLSIESATVGDTTFSVPSATKVVGSFGTESVHGVVATNNDIGFPNREGFFFLGPEKQYYGILRTKEQTVNIRPYWRSLADSGISGVASYFFDAKVFISVATGTSGNDRVIIYDTERGNWIADWSIGAKQFLQYTDTAGNSHFLYIPEGGSQLVELSENFLGDLGSAFSQSYISPLIPVSKRMTDIMNLKEAIVELGSPRGSVTFKVLGIGKDSSFTTIATATITNFGANTGVGSDLAGDFFATSTNDNSRGGAGSWVVYFTDTPSVFTQAITKKAVKKRKKLYAIQFQVSSTTADTDFTINKIQAKGTLIGRRLPSSWAN